MSEMIMNTESIYTTLQNRTQVCYTRQTLESLISFISTQI